MAWTSLYVLVAFGLVSLLINVASSLVPSWLARPWLVFPLVLVGLAAVVALELPNVRNRVETEPARPVIDPPYQPVPSVAPDVWLLQPQFGVVPYLGREELLGDLDAWRTEGQPFSIGLVTGEGGSGKSRLAAELCVRMRALGWEAGQLSTAEALTAFTPASSTLLVVDYPEQSLAVLGAALERLATRIDGPPVRVLLLARQWATQSHWWADLDRMSHRTASSFTTLRLDLRDHGLSLPERQRHAAAATQAFGRLLGIEPATVPDVADEKFANPLLVHVAALLALRGQHSDQSPLCSVPEDVLGHLLDRERNRWARLRARHQLADLHDTHALRVVLLAVLTRPLVAEVADVLAALPELSGPALSERRGRIGYWLAELYPGESLLASFGPDLLVEELLDVTARGSARLDEVVAAIHHHGTTNARHLSRLLATLRLAADRRPAVFSVLHGYLAAHLTVIVQRALADPDDGLLTTVGSVLAFYNEQDDPEWKLALACGGLQYKVPAHQERGAELLCTTMQLALPLFRAIADADPKNHLDVLIVGLCQMNHRYVQAGRYEEALAVNVECVQVRRQLADRDADGSLIELSFDLGNLAVAHLQLDQHQEALAAAKEAVGIQQQLAKEGNGDEGYLAIALHRLSTIDRELNRYDEALAANAQALPVLRLQAEQDPTYYRPLVAAALGNRGAILSGLDRHDEGLAATAEAIEIRERLAVQQTDAYLCPLQYDLHNVSQMNILLDRHDDALAAAERAVALSRQLVAANPRPHRLMLINNLDQLAKAYVALNRPDDAVAALEEAIDLSRQNTDSDLAAIFDRLIHLLTHLDLYADALPVCQESAALLRRLSESQPHWLPQLSSTLGVLSQVLHRLDQPDEALRVAQEAVEIARHLDESQRLTLARALINLGDHYTRRQHTLQALEHTAEGVELLCLSSQPTALVPALAKLAALHADLQHRHGARALAIVAVQVGESVHEPHRDPRWSRDFSYALQVLSQVQMSFGRAEDAVEPLTRAVRLHQELAKTDPNHYLPGFAAGLHSLAIVQAATGRYQEAIASCQQGSEIYEQLADADEDQHLRRFAGSLRHLLECLVTAGEYDDAVPVAHRQADIARRLLAKDPEFRGLLVDSYKDLVRVLSLVGDFAGARQIAALADTYQQVPLEDLRRRPDRYPSDQDQEAHHSAN